MAIRQYGRTVRARGNYALPPSAWTSSNSSRQISLVLCICLVFCSPYLLVTSSSLNFLFGKSSSLLPPRPLELPTFYASSFALPFYALRPFSWLMYSSSYFHQVIIPSHHHHHHFTETRRSGSSPPHPPLAVASSSSSADVESGSARSLQLPQNSPAALPRQVVRSFRSPSSVLDSLLTVLSPAPCSVPSSSTPHAPYPGC
eukprot:GHVS01012746.1.p1 GENE.GHVS01012746.1~~GHVS01012746.1.p1  ORF type:complete len:201 (-),score=46.94 GHVS01012746.1:56-658(-)